MTTRHSLRFASALAALGFMAGATAGPDHDHSHDAPQAGTARSLPRFAATSESFELVGILEDKRLVLYLDRFADNTPVKDAKLELELGGAKLVPKPAGEGLFEAVLAQAPKPGVIPVTATVVAGGETDLLAGELDLHEEAKPAEAHTHAWWRYATVLAALALLAGLGTVAVRRIRRPR